MKTRGKRGVVTLNSHDVYYILLLWWDKTEYFKIYVVQNIDFFFFTSYSFCFKAGVSLGQPSIILFQCQINFQKQQWIFLDNSAQLLKDASVKIQHSSRNREWGHQKPLKSSEHAKSQGGLLAVAPSDSSEGGRYIGWGLPPVQESLKPRQDQQYCIWFKLRTTEGQIYYETAIFRYVWTNALFVGRLRKEKGKCQDGK